MQKLLIFFLSRNISICSIFNDQSLNITLTNDIVSFEQVGPENVLPNTNEGEDSNSSHNNRKLSGEWIYFQGRQPSKCFGFSSVKGLTIKLTNLHIERKLFLE